MGLSSILFGDGISGGSRHSQRWSCALASCGTAGCGGDLANRRATGHEAEVRREAKATGAPIAPRIVVVVVILVVFIVAGRRRHSRRHCRCHRRHRRDLCHVRCSCSSSGAWTPRIRAPGLRAPSPRCTPLAGSLVSGDPADLSPERSGPRRSPAPPAFEAGARRASQAAACEFTAHGGRGDPMAVPRTDARCVRADPFRWASRLGTWGALDACPADRASIEGAARQQPTPLPPASVTTQLAWASRAARGGRPCLCRPVCIARTRARQLRPRRSAASQSKAAPSDA